MSNQSHYEMRARDEAPRVLWGSWLCNNASNPDATSIQGAGVVSVTKTANAGEFEVTLDDSYPLVGAPIGVKHSDGAEPAAAVDFHFDLTNFTTTNKFLIKYRQNGAGINRTAANNVRIGFVFFFKNRS